MLIVILSNRKRVHLLTRSSDINELTQLLDIVSADSVLHIYRNVHKGVLRWEFACSSDLLTKEDINDARVEAEQGRML